MSGYITFEGCVIAIEWGDAVYTVLPLSPDVMDALGHPKRVEGEINDHPVNLAPQKAPVIEDVFLWAGKSLLDRIGIAPGEPLEVRLRPADPDAVALPADVQAALFSAGRLAAWEAMTPGKRRAALHDVTSAKRAETRARRLAALIERLG